MRSYEYMNATKNTNSRIRRSYFSPFVFMVMGLTLVYFIPFLSFRVGESGPTAYSDSVSTGMTPLKVRKS